MTKYTVDFPIVGWMSTEIEFDGTADELQEAIESDDVEVPVDISKLQDWYPTLNIRDFDFGASEIPMQLVILE